MKKLLNSVTVYCSSHVSYRICLLILFGITHQISQPVTAQIHQTATFSPLLTDGQGLPFEVVVRPYLNIPRDSLPTLHSFAKAEFDGKWVLIGGRTNGLHGFTGRPSTNFPVSAQNRSVWIIDPASGMTWSRSLEGSGLDADAIASLSSANNQFTQVENKLYVTGGYGANGAGTVDTLDTLAAIDLPAMISWAQGGAGDIQNVVRHVRDPLFRVTGGAMYHDNGQFHIVFGQDYPGGYVPGKVGSYTQQVKSFTFDDGLSGLSFTHLGSTTPDSDYHRRDLNVLSTRRQDEFGNLESYLTVLSGVFTPSIGGWTVPVEVSADGTPSMADPLLPSTFRQSVNNYHSAKIGLYSPADDAFYGVLFGGIGVQYWDPQTSTLVTDNEFPFMNQIAVISRDTNGEFAQHWAGEMPVVVDTAGTPLRFGTNAEFFIASGMTALEHDMIDLGSLTEETTIGHIFGGLASNAPHTRGRPGAYSVASNMIFEVILRPVPEPGLGAGVILFSALFLRRRKTA